MKVAIVTDSLTNLTAADLDRYPDVYYGYLNVIVNDKAYAEQKEINNKELFRMIDEGATYSTSQPAPEEFVQLYTKLLQDYDYILGLFCTNHVSGTVNSARIASTMVEGAEGRITVIDTNTAAIGVENVLLRVCQLLEEGKDVEELIKVVEFYKTHGPMYLYVDDLNTLVRTNELKALMEEACKDQVEVHVGNEIGPVMAIHFGRGGVGACWMPDQYNI